MFCNGMTSFMWQNIIPPVTFIPWGWSHWGFGKMVVWMFWKLVEIWLWINTYENTIFRGMNIQNYQLFWCELQGYKVLTHCHMLQCWPSTLKWRATEYQLLPQGSRPLVACQDNILMELVSETVVMVVPRELFWQKPSNEEVSGTYFKVNLKPGEGIVIPSNYLHSVHWLVWKMFIFEMGFHDPLWLFYPSVNKHTVVAIESDQFTDDLPIKHGDFHSYVSLPNAIFQGWLNQRPGSTSACGPAWGELLFRAPLRKYAVAQQFGELLCRNCQREKRTLGHEVVVVSICQRSLEQIWKRCPFPRLEDGNSMSDVFDGATWCNSHRIEKRCRVAIALWFVLQGGQQCIAWDCVPHNSRRVGTCLLFPMHFPWFSHLKMSISKMAKDVPDICGDLLRDLWVSHEPFTTFKMTHTHGVYGTSKKNIIITSFFPS